MFSLILNQYILQEIKQLSAGNMSVLLHSLNRSKPDHSIFTNCYNIKNTYILSHIQFIGCS